MVADWPLTWIAEVFDRVAGVSGFDFGRMSTASTGFFDPAASAAGSPSHLPAPSRL